MRDKALQSFKHYYEKMSQLNRKKHEGAEKIQGSGVLSGLGFEKGEEVLNRVIFIIT